MEEPVGCGRAQELLVVEDDKSQLRTLIAIMEAEGFDVVGCSTAGKALEHLEHMKTGVVVLDLRLPDLNGTQLLERLSETADGIRVVIHTAYSSYQSAKDALNLGAFAYVEKGGDPEELIRQVHRASEASLRSYANGLETAVAERTRDLRQMNELLKKEIEFRKQAEEQLRQESAMRSKLLDNIPCIAMILKKGTREIVASNEAATKVGAVPGKTCYETCAERDDNCPWCLAPEVWATNEPRRLEVEYRGTYYEGIWVSLAEDLYVHYIFDITERKRAEQALHEHQAKLKAMATEILRTEERERRRIAVGLHDDISQKLVLTKLTLESSKKLASDPNVLASLTIASEAIAETIEEAESLTFALANPVLQDLGLVMALRKHLAEELQERHGIAFELEDDQKLSIANKDIRSCLFRVSRELLMNVVKHAGARKVTVSLGKSRGRVWMRIQDDGVGFEDAEAGSEFSGKRRFGLFSVREQLECLGGHLRIESERGRGTTATAVVPLEERPTV